MSCGIVVLGAVVGGGQGSATGIVGEGEGVAGALLHLGQLGAGVGVGISTAAGSVGSAGTQTAFMVLPRGFVEALGAYGGDDRTAPLS